MVLEGTKWVRLPPGVQWMKLVSLDFPPLWFASYDSRVTSSGVSVAWCEISVSTMLRLVALGQDRGIFFELFLIHKCRGNLEASGYGRFCVCTIIVNAILRPIAHGRNYLKLEIHAEECLFGSTIEYGYYTDNKIFGWANKMFWLIKFSWLYQLFWLIQPNTVVNLKKRFCSNE